MSLNRLIDNQIENQALDLLYAAKMLLIEIEFNHNDLNRSQEVNELNNACDKLKRLFFTMEGAR